ncbi:hypothetical protein [Spongiactinospora sp. TRM90649]|uniref:hypothetical protein n=1 Tax=Spongiactinospora sp. TRM90649 TaxID=3031114 RepID=UPI0023F87B46|nr:hypothetical protein [Spongiactinospora sp. TRM90649]MDF5752015.1 hypothetical protein [Spongiactinospora sp. TRM90649]
MRRTMLAVVALLTVLGVPGAAWASGGPVPSLAEHGAQGPVVALIGVPGLRWEDLSARETPNLWRLAGQSALGTMSIRTVGPVTCPYDGWLTVSAGVRSAVGYRCGLPPVPEARGAGAVIPDYGYLHHVAGQRHAGALGEALRAAGRCATAIGPGGALALADRSGAVGVYLPSADGLTAAALARCPIVAADVDDLARAYLAGGSIARVAEPLSAGDRAAAVRQADAKVGTVLAALPPAATVLVAGLADHGSIPHLRAAMLRAPQAAGRTLGSSSTHLADVTIIPDITATLLHAAGVAPPANVVGTPLTPGTGTTGPVADAAAAFEADDAAGQTIRNTLTGFFFGLAVLQLVFYLVAFLLMRRRRALVRVRVAALALSSVPVASLLVNLAPWGGASNPLAAHVGVIVAIALLITAVALAGPWRRAPLGPLAVVAGVTGLALAADLLTGTTLQLNSVMGYTSVVGSRYYGLGNIPFALLATGILLTSTVVAHHLLSRGMRAAAVAAVLALGGVAMILGGWPGIGSDFGGVIAFLPGIAVTALMIAGRRVSPVKLGAFCVAGGVVVMAIAFLDSLRPPAAQTHLGRFVGQVVSGEAVEVILRKLAAMIGTLANPILMPILIGAAAFLVYAVRNPGQASAGVVTAAFEHSPALRAGLVGTLVSGVVGMLVNDSGAAVLSMALALAVPLVLAAGISALPGAGRSPSSDPVLPASVPTPGPA